MQKTSRDTFRGDEFILKCEMAQQGAFFVMFSDLLNVTKQFLQAGKKSVLLPLWGAADTWDWIFFLNGSAIT